VSYIVAGDAADLETLLYCCGWEACPVLYPPEPLLLECNDELSVPEKYS
jgi:hypothetical protein